MSRRNRQSQGFTLIASMLLLALLSSIAIGLMFLANGSGHIGNNDLEANVAYYGAESGMEKLTTDLLALYQAKLSPTSTDLNNLAAASAPSSALVGNMTYKESAAWTNPAPGPSGLPQISTSIIGAGPYAGLNAQMIPITLQVSAIRPSGAAVNMTRGIQVALIPVFQFGVFSDSDLSYFPGPLFNFKGRVHTNGNLYLAAGTGLILASNVTAHGEIIRDVLANGFGTGANYPANVLLPSAPQGCDNNPTFAIIPGSCDNLAPTAGSWSGGVPPAGAAVSPWSSAPFTQFLTKGAPTLTLPFVQGSALNSSAQQIQIVKEPPVGESISIPLGASREFNKANIRIMLADTPQELHPLTHTADAFDIDLATYAGTVAGVGIAHALYVNDTNWQVPGSVHGPGTTWPLIPGFLRVEYLNSAGIWNPIAQEWLQFGFARGPDSLTVGGTVNTVHSNAIIVLQKKPALVGPTSGNWYPINLFDPREGFPRDQTVLADPQCYVNGIMNAVELDVGNLDKWLRGVIAGSGSLVDPSPQNGYLVYFSDRRGQSVITPKVGEYGFEDVINSGSANGMPDGALDASVSPSPEDVDQDGFVTNGVDVKGAENVGNGFGVDTLTSHNPYQAVDCSLYGRANAVTGARHALKLVNGVLNLPTNSLPTPGFTVAAENPVYVQGDYNSNSADTVWNEPTPVDMPHPAAAVIADALTLLSVNWTDDNSLLFPNSLASRPAARTDYRMAIASGKNINFPRPGGGGNDFGTDGGVHNFLRYIENWGGSKLYYRGSMVSLYYAQYATGTFKCCNLVYSPPERHYSFDEDFLTPSNLPPGTPMLQDIENLTYWQNFSPCTTQSGGNCTN